MYQAKSLIQSKTFWIACAQAAFGILVVFGSTYPTVGWIVLVKSGLDMILRIYTTQPITGITQA
jgi:hypothetical protein